MLVLSRKEGESLVVGNAVIHFLRTGTTIKVGITAPHDVHVRRSELPELPPPQEPSNGEGQRAA